MHRKNRNKSNRMINWLFCFAMMVWLKPNQQHMSIASKGANDNNKCQQFQRWIKLDPIGLKYSNDMNLFSTHFTICTQFNQFLWRIIIEFSIYFDAIHKTYHFDRRNVKEEEMDIWHFSLNISPLWCCLIRNLAVNPANTTIILTECSDRDVDICFDLCSIRMMWYTSDVFICEKRVKQVATRKYRAHSKRRQIILLAINFQSSKYLNAFLRRSF